MPSVRIDSIPRDYPTEYDENGVPTATAEHARLYRIEVRYSVLNNQGAVVYTASWTGPATTPASEIRDYVIADATRYYQARQRMGELDAFVGATVELTP